MPKCKICDNSYHPFVDFGLMPIANAFRASTARGDEYKFHMQVGFCDSCKMVQLTEQPDRDQMFHENYAFFSFYLKSYEVSFSKVCTELCQKKKLNGESFVVEIGCNDGILLQNFLHAKVPCLGVEPSGNVAQVARNSGLTVLECFFDENVAVDIMEKMEKQMQYSVQM